MARLALRLKGLLLFSHTANLVELFNDKLVISSALYHRLGELDQCYKFMTDWREESLDNNSQFVSTKLWFDLQFMCLGFRSMVTINLAQFPNSVIKLALINQDGVENHCC